MMIKWIFLFALLTATMALATFDSAFAVSHPGLDVIVDSDSTTNGGMRIVRVESETNEDRTVITGNDGFKMIVDYSKLTVTIDGREMPIIIDYPANLDSAGREEFLDGIRYDMTRSDTVWVHLPYNRFDVYIDSVYYFNNTPALDEFWDLFEPRYELMESINGWSSEKFYGKKLEIYVESTTGCSGGYALPGEAHILFSDPLYMSGCKLPYYEGGAPYFGNPGELGDWWRYMNTALHEATHSIGPLPIYANLWLTEGWAEYNMYNIISDYGDINQETADTYIYQGNYAYNWVDYVANDYHDCTVYNREIQKSAGYDITAWMYSMLRDDYNLDWDSFYELMANNNEVLYKSLGLGGDYITDTHIIDLFTRTIGQDMYPVFRYDGPSGPGWGVRNWESLNWYADLTPSLSFSSTYPTPDDTVQLMATVANNGDVSLDSVSVRFYNGVVLLADLPVWVAAQSDTTISTPFNAPDGDYVIYARVDEDNIKIETSDTNNTDSATLTIFADTDSDGVADVIDNCLDISNPGQEDADLDGIGDVCDTCTDTDGDGYGNPGYAANTCTDDNCPDTANADQADTNGDGIGDACCCLARGDVDASGGIDVGDLTYLVAYLFQGGPSPPCPEQGDVDGSGGIDVGDLTYLVAYLFQGGPTPGEC